MHLVGSKAQQVHDPLYDASGAIVSGGVQLVLPVHPSRSHLFFQNNGTHTMFLEVGSARATVTISGGALGAFTVTNPGFNFTNPPVVQLLGGGNAGNSSYLGLGQPGGAAPTSALTQAYPVAAHCVMATSAVSGSKVSSIVVDQPGAGFVTAPFVFLMNSDLDPYGCALPASGTGIQVLPTGSVYYNGTACFTDSVSVYGTPGDAFTCKWML